MKTNYIKSILLAGLMAFTTVSCVDDLDQEPPYEVTSASVYRDFVNYKQVLAKIYAGYALTGQQGPAGDPDILGGDEGFSSYLRQYWQLQELPTDEAVIGWGDVGLSDLHEMDWTPNNQFITAMFARIFYQVSLTNEFIRETTDAKLEERGITGANLELAKEYRAEARFLRALSYWHALDLFGSVPFVTEEDEVGAFFPEQISREELFNYIESELLAIEDELVPARQNEYGRADQAAAWTLLTKLYLNAEVYTGEERYADAVTYAEKVIGAGYELEENYENLFLADNNTADGIIFAIAFDGLRTQTYGGTTYLVHAPVGGSMDPAEFGIDGGWSGLRTTEQIVDLFPTTTGVIDERAMFYTEGQAEVINDITDFTDGYPITKYRNVTSTGEVGSHPGRVFVDTDFPMFRLADVYLMYAEAVLRGGGGDVGMALELVNALRERAYNDDVAGRISANELTLDFILDERARELSWEAQRRTDLIRFNKFTTDNYLWAWKGGVPTGTAVPEFREIYPIPTADILANPNLEQNPGY
ncbi:putative outer membrane starch-binding protein [Pontibacter ummariensis]|uniref:Starch-binding associating with outer membrane n=1 Tax=Pontibacter ummariensis TaxID=1610492 RepID=A0A239I7T0_9BACT|nr:RagB/SusD family nutrient uptake outer membrane protein [Pontibacter ummariensis]PRY10000.1 putative outer membrane starch-binding protein [Pontibacter ummariensis]SNS89607.1 Starch-binding associating with outer membrane [Pontibacter ummariensis]